MPAQAVSLPISRNLAIQLVLGGYAFLAYNLLTAESNPLYRSKVRDTIGLAVPCGGLKVLEVGIGAAANLEFYPSGTKLVGLDADLPGADVRRGIEARGRESGIRVKWLMGNVEELPFKDEAFDAVIMTKVLCSVADPPRALREVSRVLAPGGRLGYVEHVAADSGSLLEGQQLLIDPFQQAVAGNCHLHRDTDHLIRQSVRGTAQNGAELFRSEESAERYQVWQMWPIMQQAAGVVTK